MIILETKRKEMAEKLEALYVKGFEMLKKAYPSEASQKTLTRMNKILKIEISERLSVTAGLAKAQKGNIGGRFEYNYAIIQINGRLHEGNPNELEPTFMHELAHIAANFLMNKHCKHGSAWKAVMDTLGQPPEILHTMDVSALRPKTNRIEYKCVNCNKSYMITKHKHNKHLRALEENSWFIRCGKCRGELITG